MRLAWTALLLVIPTTAMGYGYTREDDPLLKSFRAAVKAVRAGDLAEARSHARTIAWQTSELEDPKDLGVKFAGQLQAAHAEGTASSETIRAWTNLVYLALFQKFHWNLAEKLSDYHKARARLDAAQTYYEVALAGNVKKQDAARQEADPKAPSRHEDIVAHYELARAALGSPGLFGTGKRAADVDAFRKATVRIAGHLNAAFPDFVRPGAKTPPQHQKQPKKP